MPSLHRPSAVAASAALALMLATLLSLPGAASAGEGGAPEPATEESADCLTLLTNAADCLSFVEEGSNATVPEKPCCGELRDLANTNVTCLCLMLTENNPFEIPFDISKALKLPSICDVDTPPPSLCALAGIPIAAPAKSPSQIEPPKPSDSDSPADNAQRPTGPSMAATIGRFDSFSYLIGSVVALLLFLLLF